MRVNKKNVRLSQKCGSLFLLFEIQTGYVILHQAIRFQLVIVNRKRIKKMFRSAYENIAGGS